jgi:hypothetical protein
MSTFESMLLIVFQSHSWTLNQHATENITVHFDFPQNAQNEVRYVPCCDEEEGSDT